MAKLKQTVTIEHQRHSNQPMAWRKRPSAEKPEASPPHSGGSHHGKGSRMRSSVMAAHNKSVWR